MASPLPSFIIRVLIEPHPNPGAGMFSLFGLKSHQSSPFENHKDWKEALINVVGKLGLIYQESTLPGPNQSAQGS